ncbi:hypothetical protein [Raineyella sp.]|uniref:hypothetical protein n=1 Tax=Raineyella sp. TaxID=1911550 RepID=UPI002B21A76E|nr:hypothetical protein [Raineyella sp.]MEA5154299.1 hypothetical protein [Raineyella sp.]
MRKLWPFVVALLIFVGLLLGVLFGSYADRLPGAARTCEKGLGVAGGSSCQLAVATRDSVRKATSTDVQFTVSAYDPTSRADLSFTCRRGEVVRCEAATGQVVVIKP